MALTIKDVAREAGVSIATVSRVLNDKDKVRDTTRRKIENAVKKLNFHPDPIARTMIVKETRTLALCIPTLANEYWSLLAEVIQEEVGRFDYILMFFIMGLGSRQKDENYFRTIIRRRVDGIILGSVANTLEGSEAFAEIIKKEIPMVALDMKLPGIHRVSGDHLGGAMEAVNHLFQLGHRRIAYIHSGNEVDDRELGYRNAHSLRGLTVNETLIVRENFGIETGYRGMRELLETGEEFTAVFCWNDLLAVGVVKALQDYGRRVPEDVAVIGYDDISLAGLIKPALTTIKQPIREIGATLVQLLLEAIDHRGKPQIPRNVTLRMQLRIRESCGAGVGKNLLL